MKKGFTIVEILVVIGIIAVLTVIIFPAINNIRAKNRDAERVADIATLQLGLSLYYSQHSTSTGGYPITLQDLVSTYVPSDSLLGPDGKTYSYVPLRRATGPKCTYYHLGVQLEMTSAQIDMADNFDSKGGESDHVINSGGYYWCTSLPNGSGLAPGGTNYNVHP